MDKVLARVSEFLGLESRIIVRIETKRHKVNAAHCESYTGKSGKITRHVISIFLPNTWKSEFDFNSVLAHELIHAWQAENNMLIDGEYHNTDFQIMARRVELYMFTEYGTELIAVYSPETDKD